MSKTVALKKEVGVRLYEVERVIENDDSGNKIKCPTLAYAHITIPTGFGDMVLHGFRVLRGTDGNPFVARPGRTRKLFDERGNQVSTQRYNDVRIDGADADKAFEQAIKNRVLEAFNS